MLKTKIESLLFAAHKPLSAKFIANFLNKEGEKTVVEEVLSVLVELKQKYNIPESGIQLVDSEGEVQMVTNSEAAALIKVFLKEDMTGELTPASLEALTVIAYRGPIAKPELEQIRGVNCTLIIRNLLIRGLITMNEVNGQPYYFVTTDFLKYLGINTVAELPDYEKLNKAENLEQYLDRRESETSKNSEISKTS